MLSIIGTVVGLLGSFIPELLKFWKQKADHKHEIEMTKLQMDAAKLQGQIRLEEIGAMADIEESKALYAAAEQKITGWKFVDGLVSLYNSSVRPTITYAFMLLYMYVKYSVIYGMMQMGQKWQEIGSYVWGSEDFAMFSTILAFYFGGRFMRYSLQRIDKK